MIIDIGRGSATFEYKSKYPGLHCPAYPVASSSMVTPRGASALLDGEWLTFDADRKLARPAGDPVGLGGAAGAAANHNCFIYHGNPTRSDIQVAEYVPITMDDNFEFITRLHTGNQEATTGGGTQALGLGDPCHLVVTTLTIDGTDYAGKTALDSLATATATGHYVARVLVTPDADGWARFYASKGFNA